SFLGNRNNGGPLEALVRAFSFVLIFAMGTTSPMHLLINSLTESAYTSMLLSDAIRNISQSTCSKQSCSMESESDKKAWFPKITEDFLAAYQANYGFTKDGVHDPNAARAPDTDTPAKPEEGEKAEKSTDPEQSKEADAAWFDVETDKNTNVYVSGLPLDITTEEFVELMSKCGIVMRDPVSEEYKVKLYRDGYGNQKGDGRCCYLKKESVALTEGLIDESEIRGYQLHVEAARFELKGQYDASKKKKKSKDYRKRMKAQQKQLDWRPEKKGEARMRHERVLIIQNMFHPSDFEVSKDLSLSLPYL
uniref:HIV-1 Tat specific factor 1 n=1 Tax=Hucho hucho TaxID=62062 RepID=A0A4W5N3R6_9TELE